MFYALFIAIFLLSTAPPSHAQSVESYIDKVERRIQDGWSTYDQKDNSTATLSFVIAADGNLLEVKPVNQSGNQVTLARQCIECSTPFEKPVTASSMNLIAVFHGKSVAVDLAGRRRTPVKRINRRRTVREAPAPGGAGDAKQALQKNQMDRHRPVRIRESIVSGKYLVLSDDSVWESSDERKTRSWQKGDRVYPDGNRLVNGTRAQSININRNSSVYGYRTINESVIRGSFSSGYNKPVILDNGMVFAIYSNRKHFAYGPRVLILARGKSDIYRLLIDDYAYPARLVTSARPASHRTRPGLGGESSAQSKPSPGKSSKEPAGKSRHQSPFVKNYGS